MKEDGRQEKLQLLKTQKKYFRKKMNETIRKRSKNPIRNLILEIQKEKRTIYVNFNTKDEWTRNR